MPDPNSPRQPAPGPPPTGFGFTVSDEDFARIFILARRATETEGSHPTLAFSAMTTAHTPAFSPPLSRMDRSLLLAPLPREQLFNPGTVFPAHELTRRVLSLFWGDCCCPPYFCRAPAPVVEFDRPIDAPATRPMRAWWLRGEGIAEEGGGPQAETLRSFFHPTNEADRRWPRYEFRVFAESTGIEMIFHRGGLASLGHRTWLRPEADGRLRVLAREPWWVR